MVSSVRLSNALLAALMLLILSERAATGWARIKPTPAMQHCDTIDHHRLLIVWPSLYLITRPSMSPLTIHVHGG